MIYCQQFRPRLPAAADWLRLGRSLCLTEAYAYIDPISDSTTSSTIENPSQETTTVTETVVYPVSAVDYSETLTSIYLAVCAVLVALGVIIGSIFMNTLFKRWF